MKMKTDCNFKLVQRKKNSHSMFIPFIVYIYSLFVILWIQQWWNNENAQVYFDRHINKVMVNEWKYHFTISWKKNHKELLMMVKTRLIKIHTAQEWWWRWWWWWWTSYFFSCFRLFVFLLSAKKCASDDF